MSASEALTLAISVLLSAYLIFALLRGEKL